MSILKKPDAQKDDYLVCACMEVMHSQLVEEIKKGAVTVKELSERLGVTTGCSSCLEEVVQILKEAQDK